MDLVRESKKSTHPIPYMNSEQKGVFEKREGVKKGLSFCGKIVFDTSAHAYYCHPSLWNVCTGDEVGGEGGRGGGKADL